MVEVKVERGSETRRKKFAIRRSGAFIDTAALVDVIEVTVLIERDASGIRNSRHDDGAAAIATDELNDRPRAGARVIEAPITIAMNVYGNPDPLEPMISVCEHA